MRILRLGDELIQDLELIFRRMAIQTAKQVIIQRVAGSGTGELYFPILAKELESEPGRFSRLKKEIFW